MYHRLLRNEGEYLETRRQAINALTRKALELTGVDDSAILFTLQDHKNRAFELNKPFSLRKKPNRI